MGLGVGLLLFLVLSNLNSFKETSIRFTDIWKADPLLNFFEDYNQKSTAIYDESIAEIGNWVEGVIDEFEEIKQTDFKELLLNLLYNFLDFSLNFFIYFCNYGLNIILVLYIFLHETFSGTQLEIRTTPLTFLYLKVDSFFLKIRTKTKQGIKWCFNWLSDHRRPLTLYALTALLACGILYRIIVEIIIFAIAYVIRMVNMETYLVVFGFVQFLFTLIYPYLKYIPLWLWIPTLVLLVFLRAVARANYKLQKNHQRLKEFASDDLTQTTFINGPPGTGKTLLNVSLALASEENFIDELEKKLLDYELKYKYINFAKIRENPDVYPEHKEYARIYQLLNERKSFIISNFAIYSPLFDDYSKIFNFDYMRVNKPTDIYPLEEYIVISISEFDKEYNSHDNKKEVGEDGAATFFSTVSHDLKRHAKVFVDYQLKDQVPLRIRGNSEYFITIKDRKRRYPILLFVYYLPFLGLNKLCKYFIKKYEIKKNRISRKSMRKSVAKYKRNDITLPYAILRSLATTLKKICDWFDSFYYFKLSTRITQEDDIGKGTKKSLCINIRDLSYNNQQLYDSTFLSFSYEQKKNEEFKNLDTFTKLAPSKEELEKCNSRFYNNINH